MNEKFNALNEQFSRLEEKVREKVLGDVRSLSSGTIATLTNITHGQDVDFIRNAFVSFATDDKQEFKSWNAAWSAFIKKHGLKEVDNKPVNGKRLIASIEKSESMNEGSLLNFGDFADENKEFGKLYKLLEKCYGLRDKVEKDIYKWEELSKKALKLANKLKEEQFPADTKSGGGKGNTEYVIKKALENLSKVSDLINMRIG